MSWNTVSMKSTVVTMATNSPDANFMTLFLKNNGINREFPWQVRWKLPSFSLAVHL
jgi:hypothetical protein